MVKVAGELSGSAPIFDDANEKTTMSRRDFNKKAALAYAGLLAAGGVGTGLYLQKRGTEEVGSTAETTDGYFTVLETEDIIRSLEIPNMYENRPWANPENYIGYMPEELKLAAALKFDESTTDEELVGLIGRGLDTAAAFGWSKANLEEALQRKHIFNKKSYLGTYGDYVKKYTTNWMSGQFQKEIVTETGTLVSEELANYFSLIGDNFADVISDGKWRGGEGVAPSIEVVGFSGNKTNGISDELSIDVTFNIPTTTGLDMTYEVPGSLIVQREGGSVLGLDSYSFSTQ